MEKRRVAIIGAGISGLLACKYAAARGYDPVVFEERDDVGGVWNHTIESTRLQTARTGFQFSDFPWPPSVEDMYPTNFQVVEYIESYVSKFELLKYVRLEWKVMEVDYVGELEEEMEGWEMWGGDGKAFGSKGKWIINLVHTKTNLTKVYEAEFLIICIGRYSGLPNIPKFPSPQIFKGKVLHSMDYSAMENAAAAHFIKGKRVAVVGFRKSAVDIAFECANANGVENPCTIIVRTAHWTLPNANPWGLDLGFFCATRFSELMLHKPHQGFLSSLLATLLKPLRWAMSKFVESYVRWKLPLRKYGMVPKENLLEEIPSCQIFMAPPTFYDKVENGSIVLKKSQNLALCEEGLVVDGEDGKNLVKADVVIFATGYKGDEKLSNIFKSPTFKNLIASSTIPLYRHVIHPRIPRMAVIGYSESLSNLLTFEMRCKWLLMFLDGGIELPRIGEMEKEVEMWERYMKRCARNGKINRACISGVHIWCNDQLCKDMGFNPKRKKGFFKDLFQPYTLADYNGVLININ